MIDDLDDNSCFNPRQWIGQGKQYKDVPLVVVYARSKVLTIPPDAQEKLPRPDLPIVQFVCLQLPNQSASLNTFPLEQWFSTETPSNKNGTDIYAVISRRSIPSLATLDQLEGAFGQKWFDGAQSICDPRYNRGSEKFPLWVLELWKAIRRLKRAQDDWRDAFACVSHWIKQPSVFERFPTAESVFGSCGWASEVHHGGTEFVAWKFTQLLQNAQLNDDITQAMTYQLQCRLADNDEQSQKHFIAASRFYQVLNIASTRQKYKNGSQLPSSLRFMEQAIQNNPKLKVWFAVLHRNHEVAICIDFEKRTIAYGKQNIYKRRVITDVRRHNTWVHCP